MHITTSGGPALVEVDGDRDAARFLLVLTHGSGGGIDPPDVLAVRDAGLELGGAVARVVQPYRVRGARAPGSAERQDAAWAEIVAELTGLVPGVPLVQGGRSNGARVACRTAAAVGARAVIALAFPLSPPRKARGDRLDELRAARTGGAAVLVLNGERDPFGIPGPQEADRVVVVPGETHALRGHRAVIAAAVTEWLPTVLARAPTAPLKKRRKPVNKEETRKKMRRSSPPSGVERVERADGRRNGHCKPLTPELVRCSGRWGLLAVPGGRQAGSAVEEQVGGPVRLDGRPVWQELPRVLEDHNAVAEQAPALLRVADNGVRRFAVRC